MRAVTTFLASALTTVTVAQQPAPPCPTGYEAALWTRAWRVHDAAIVVDTHSDTTSRVLDENFDVTQRASTGHMDLPRIVEGGLDAQFYAIYVASSYFGDEDLSSENTLAASRPNASAHRALAMIDGFFRMIESTDGAMVACTSVADLRRTVDAGKHAALMGIEGGHAIEGSLALLRQFHRLGVRYMTLTHGNHNHFADSSGEAVPRWNGLNRLGVKVVREMNRLGMMVDVSHVSDATFRDALAVTRAPVILSHSSCRALCGHPRNVTDEMLRAVAENGGVVMINFNCGFLSEDYEKQRSAWRTRVRIREQAIAARHAPGSPENEAAVTKLRAEHPEPEPIDLAVLIAHFEHAINVAGIEHVGLGSDFDGVPCVPRGMDDVTFLPRITYHLLENGHSEADVTKVLGGNLLRVFEAVERVALDLAAEPAWRDAPDDRTLQPGR